MTHIFSVLKGRQSLTLLIFLYMFRNIKKSEGDIPVPPLVKSAALWGIPNSVLYYLLGSSVLLLWLCCVDFQNDLLFLLKHCFTITFP